MDPRHHSPLGGDAPSQAMRAFGAFHRAMHAQRQLMARRMARNGVHPAQALVLREVAHNEGISQRDIAAKLHMARPTVTIMLQKMEKAGLIERRPDAEDQRFMRIYLSASGHETHEEMHAQIERMVAQTVETLSAHDQAELERLLNLLAENIQSMADREVS